MSEDQEEQTTVQDSPVQPATVQQALPAETGHAAVDSMIADLPGIVELPAQDQVVAYGDVHRALQDTLATIDER